MIYCDTSLLIPIIYLAIALSHGCALATFDRDLADAARTLGVSVLPA